MHRSLAILLTSLLLQALAPLPARADAGAPDAARLKAHMAFLADDLLEGRETGTRGFDIAARYVAAQFQHLGLKPAGDAGSYLQAVALRGGQVVPDAAVFEIHRPGGTQALASPREFIIGPRLLADQMEVSAPLVFVGHGVTAPRFQHDDYAGLDVRGKIVVWLQGRPKRLPTEEGAHYANRLTKSRLAARLGAVGAIELQTPEGEQREPFSRAALYVNRLSIDWVAADGSVSREVPGLRGGAYVSAAAAAQLFTEVDVSAADVFAAAQADQPLPRMDLKLSARLSQATRRTAMSSANVVGLVEGSDPALRHEVVVFTAHLDGLGLQPSFAGDKVLNGALDNASGVATLLEVARLVAEMPVKPRRSMLFVALTGEEKGLVGSSYFAARPTVPAAALVANVNLDMPNLLIDFSEITAFGAERSSLQAAVQRAAAAVQVRLVPDPWPREANFVRSDHYSFVQHGVPAVFVTIGEGSFDPAEDSRQRREQFFRQHYHRPSDDMNLPIHWGAAVRFTRLNFLLGLDIANAAERPRWNAGDFFGELFGR
ncbi:MAG: M28 family peptidase [Burkholderiales bacterium]|nr:M28 family peptidase [Burkholderiales bacterium]